MATPEALLLVRRAGIDLDLLREALAASAASSAFIRNDLGALLDGDYRASFGLDRCARSWLTSPRSPANCRCSLTQLAERTYQEALRRYGPVDGELLAVELLEEQAGVRLRHGPA